MTRARMTAFRQNPSALLVLEHHDPGDLDRARLADDPGPMGHDLADLGAACGEQSRPPSPVRSTSCVQTVARAINTPVTAGFFMSCLVTMPEERPAVVSTRDAKGWPHGLRAMHDQLCVCADPGG